MNSCPAVNRAAALLTEGEIHGFLTPKDCDLGKVVDHVKSRQPYYANPTHFHLLDTFPMTVNGKIDKKALRARESLAEKSSPTEEKTSTEVIAFPKPAVVSHSRSDSSTSSLTRVSYTSEKSEATVVEESIDLEAALPKKRQRKRMRGLRHRILIVYRLLFTLVGIFNIAAALAVILSGIQREWLGTVPAINLALAVLIRQDFIINALYTITCSIPSPGHSLSDLDAPGFITLVAFTLALQLAPALAPRFQHWQCCVHDFKML
ncbi:Linear gramicidin synthase subunit C [Ilyonectria robusta]